MPYTSSCQMTFTVKLSFKESTMANNDHKETLFNDFFRAARGTLESLEMHYNVQGVLDQVFGKDVDLIHNTDQAKANLRNSYAWTELSALYEYAIHGITSDLDGPDSVVINGSDVIKLASSEDWRPSNEWDEIIAMGDGRFALDDGQDITIHKLALLAKVDLRTVRNAVSAGNLVSYKKDLILQGEQICVENASARRWLHGRKGFKPTVMNDGDEHQGLESVDSPAGFGVFLVSQRKRIGLDSDAGKLMVFHPSVDPKAISELEAGIFALPLDAVFPLADFYQVSRKELLDCVMRVFFADELSMLSNETHKEGDQK